MALRGWRGNSGSGTTGCRGGTLGELRTAAGKPGPDQGHRRRRRRPSSGGTRSGRTIWLRSEGEATLQGMPHRLRPLKKNGCRTSMVNASKFGVRSPGEHFIPPSKNGYAHQGDSDWGNYRRSGRDTQQPVQSGSGQSWAHTSGHQDGHMDSQSGRGDPLCPSRKMVAK